MLAEEYVVQELENTKKRLEIVRDENNDLYKTNDELNRKYNELVDFIVRRTTLKHISLGNETYYEFYTINSWDKADYNDYDLIKGILEQYGSKENV